MADVRSPADELPDLGQAGRLVSTYFAEDRDSALHVGHGGVLVARGVEQVGQVVLERRLAVAVAVGGAQRERLLGPLERWLELTRITLHERQVVESGRRCPRVAHLARR